MERETTVTEMITVTMAMNERTEETSGGLGRVEEREGGTEAVLCVIVTDKDDGDRHMDVQECRCASAQCSYGNRNENSVTVKVCVGLSVGIGIGVVREKYFCKRNEAPN